jgi:hypothetical protein
MDYFKNMKNQIKSNIPSFNFEKIKSYMPPVDFDFDLLKTNIDKIKSYMPTVDLDPLKTNIDNIKSNIPSFEKIKSNINDKLNNENIKPAFNTIKSTLPVILSIIIFIILLIVILYNKGHIFSKPTSNEAAVSNTIVISTFIILVFILCITLLPNFKELSKLFTQISNVTYVILFTIFLILFFRLLPSDILNNYAYIITPITILFTIFIFYKGIKTNEVDDFNINYERIKIIILLFCLITICFVYYSINPGGLVKKIYGTLSIFTILIGLFGFLYLIVLLTLPGNNKNTTNKSNLLDNFSKTSVYGTIGFFCFLIISTIVILTYPGGFLNDKNTSVIVLIIILFVGILWSILLIFNLFPINSTNSKDNTINPKLNTFKKALLALFGFTLSGIIITFLVYSIQNLSGQSSIISFILNIILVLIFLILIYKTIYVKLPEKNANKNAFFDMIVNLLFYIPCLFNGGFDTIMKLLVFKYDPQTTGSIILMLIAIGIFLLAYYLPSLQSIRSTQGGQLLVDNPISIDTLNTLGNTEQLNGNPFINYKYAFSFWVFIDSAPPNTNSNYEKYTSIMNFGGNPNILYKASTNTLMITMAQTQAQLQEKGNNKLLQFDDNGNRIIYINNNFLLQKWNNFIISYSLGVVDIFLNGELVKSAIGAVPFMGIDALTIGSNDGIKGGICNVIYFRRSLRINNIYHIYHSMKNKTPPAPQKTTQTIIPIKNVQ